MLASATHISSAEIGSGYSQETHPQLLFQGCSHYCELISSPNLMPRTLETAIRHAVAQRGVSVVVLPGDVALQPALEISAPKTTTLLPLRAIVTPASEDLGRLAAMLSSGSRVTLPCGSGCEGAHDQLLALGERLKAPMVHSMASQRRRASRLKRPAPKTATLLPLRAIVTPASENLGRLAQC